MVPWPRPVKMRKTPRAYPTIRLDGRLKTCDGIYYTVANEIGIATGIRRTKRVVNVIMHEETHWVMDMYLPATETDRYFNRMPEDADDRIVEKVATEMAEEITKRIFG
jgi:hypothetical protein